MFPALNRGFAVLPMLVFVALLGIVAIGVENLAPETNSQSQTASSFTEEVAAQQAATETTSEEPKVTIPDTKAPISCAAAKEKAFDKQDDGEAISIADKGDIGALDRCHGAVLIKGKKPSKNPSDYRCVGRVGTATIEPGKVTSVTFPSPAPDSKDGDCTINVCRIIDAATGRKSCEPAKLFTDGVNFEEKGGVPVLSSGDGTAPVPLSAEQAQGITDAFNDSTAAQAGVVKEAQQAVEAAEKAASVQGTATQEKVLAAAKAKLDAERATLAKMEEQKKFFADNAKTLSPTEKPGPSTGGTGIPDPSGKKQITDRVPQDDNTFTQSQPQQSPPPPPPGGDMTGGLLDQLMKALGGKGGGGQAQECSTESAIYQQQQQQYQQQLQQYQSAMQQYNYELQLNIAYGNKNPAPTRPEAPKPCSPGSGSGSSDKDKGPGTSSGTVPTAQLSCQPKVADVGMTIALAWGCSVGKSVGRGYDTRGALSGSTSVILPTPPIGTNIASFGLTCTNRGVSANAQCSVQVSKPFIIFVANPKTVPSGGTSVLGWLTGGMKSCVVSSPDQADFTAQNASNTSTSGVASTSPVLSQADFLLHCETFGGGTKDATTTVMVAP